MSNATVQFFSEALGKWTRYNVILPEEGEGPFPVLMQLHGLSDDSDAWIQRSNFLRHVEGYPMVVVLPDGGTSGYLNWKVSDRLNTHRYEDLLMRDIPAHLIRQLNVATGPWAISGLSMGGYGAMRLGLKYPDRFCSIWGHSSAFMIDEFLDPDLIQNLEDADPYRHAEALARRNDRPVISFDCGIDDRLIEHNRSFHAHLEPLGIEHHYAEHPGDHTWEYRPHIHPVASYTATEIAAMVA
jgi:S-formylglutathione hydrolase FrmB